MTAEYGWVFQNGSYEDVTHVIHGHTHNGIVKTYDTPHGEVMYVNDGAWEDDRMNYVKITISPELKVNTCELITLFNEKDPKPYPINSL